MSELFKDGLQFDTAESPDSGPSSVSCVACKAPLSSYFLVNKAVVCGGCKDRVLTARGASHVGSLFRAGLLGVLAGLLGSGLYYSVAAITGYQLGLIAIVVGLMVGFAVRKGSGGRGGWRYQALAMAICYLAICSSYLPMVYAAVVHKQAEKAEATRASGLRDAASQPSSPVSGAASTSGLGIPSAVAEETSPIARANPGGVVMAVLFLVGLTLALPFLAGFKNAIGLIIIGIALYEAWKVNRAAPFSVSGPFAVGATSNA